MSHLICKNCNGHVEADDQVCPNCGIPMPPNHATEQQRSFIAWFIALVIFCVVMMLYLPPDWSPFVGQ